MNELNHLAANTAIPTMNSTAATTWPSHLTPATDDGWTYWRDAVLRSAGFPVCLLQTFLTPELATVADQMLAAQAQAATALQQAQQWLQEKADAIAQQAKDGTHPDRSDNGWPAELKIWRRAAQGLRAPKVGAAIANEVTSLLAPHLLATLTTSLLEKERLEHAFATAWQASSEHLRIAFRDAARVELLQEAIAWQNHAALPQAIEPLALDASMPGAKRKKREALVANYLQRYCTKNDTIGFFGPMTWCRLGIAGESAEYASGALLARRVVNFEDWAIQTLAQDIAADDAYLPWLVPSLQPLLRLDAKRLLLPGGIEIALSAEQAQLLAVCDGIRTVKAIANRLLANPISPFQSTAQIFSILRDLQKTQRIYLGFAVSSGNATPEVALRKALQRIDKSDLREHALAKLDQLEAARASVAAAAGNPSKLCLAMQQLDHTFSELTGADARRHQGEVYGGRALVYEDCHRDLQLTIPEQALQPLQAALDLILDSARWYTCQIGQRYTQRFQEVFAQMQGAQPNEAISLADFWLRIQGMLFGSEMPIADLADELKAKWGAIFQPFMTNEQQSGAMRAVQIEVEQIRQAVKTSFAADDAGWHLARYQCPDLMFCAKDAAALMRGDFLAVMGEVHVGGNTLFKNSLASLHPAHEQLLQAVRSDLGQGYPFSRLSPEASEQPIRTQWVEDAAGCTEILFSQDLVSANPATALRVADLYLQQQDGALMIGKRQQAPSMSLMDALGDFLFLAAVNQFAVIAKGRYTPRITIGQLVVQRQSWRFSLQELSQLLSADDTTAYLAVRQWAVAQHLPHSAFIKAPWEDKPFFTDFSSPVYVRLFLKQIKNALDTGSALDAIINISEMLPAFSDLWLDDQAGQRYACELRVVALHEKDVSTNNNNEGQNIASE